MLLYIEAFWYNNMEDCCVNKQLKVTAKVKPAFSSNRMPSFTEFAMKPDWCRCSLSRGMTDSDQGNNYVSGFDNKIMNGV